MYLNSLNQKPGTEEVEPKYRDSISCAVLEPGAAHISRT